MKRRVVVFEDELADQELFSRNLSEHCELLILDSLAAASGHKQLVTFSPELLVVDCQFADDPFAGVDVVKYVRETFPGVPIVICSRFLGRVIGSKSLYTTYRDLPGVADVLSKFPFPTERDLLRIIPDTNFH